MIYVFFTQFATRVPCLKLKKATDYWQEKTEVQVGGGLIEFLKMGIICKKDKAA